jgi:lambda family phage portal protein
LRSEDNVLRQSQRSQIISDTRDLRRNFTLAAWLIRVHLDHVAVANFQSQNGLDSLDERIEQLMVEWQRPKNCDVAGRHDFASMIRMAEQGRTVDGDIAVMKLSNGKLQLIEGDRIRQPDSVGDFTTYKKDDFVHGVQLNGALEAKRYAICDRDPNGGYTLRSVIPAQYIHLFGYFDRPDQVRGISPLVSSLNQANDLYAANEYTLEKMKIASMIGLKIERPDDGGEDEDDEECAEGEEAPKPPAHKFDFNGPQVLNMLPGEKVDFVESKTPAVEFQQYLVTTIQNFMKSLDIPYSFAAENFTNYSGHRGALLTYRNSCMLKRVRLKQLLHDITIWRLTLWILDGDLVLPDGMTVYDLKFDWVGGSIPWIDPLKEVQANALLVEKNMACLEDLCRERGVDFYAMADKRKREIDYLNKLGIPVGSTPIVIPLEKPEEEEEGSDGSRQAA